MGRIYYFLSRLFTLAAILILPFVCFQVFSVLRPAITEQELLPDWVYKLVVFDGVNSFDELALVLTLAASPILLWLIGDWFDRKSFDHKRLPVVADAPTTVTESITLFDINPCTGLASEITIDFVVNEYQQRAGNSVAQVERTGITTDGYAMGHSVESFQVNENVLRDNFHDTWRHADGSKFKSQGVFVFNFNTGESLIDRFTLDCIDN